MASSRSHRPDSEDGTAAEIPVDETPELNIYEIHSDRIVFTEPGNTDGWIATEETVVPPE